MNNTNTTKNQSQNLQTLQTNISNISTKNISKISSMPDENLYNLCRHYGERTRIWRQRFAGLLPEVFKRKLYEKKGFYSIFEFSKKLAGMSEEQVRLVLNLEKRFSETPALKTLLTSGKVSVNKLARIVSIAKPENEIFLATQVQVLSKSAVETLVRDEKFVMKNGVETEIKNDDENRILDIDFGNKSDKKSDINLVDFSDQNGVQKSFFDSKSLPGQEQNDIKTTKSNSDKNTDEIFLSNSSVGIFKSTTLNLSSEVHQKLLELQQKGLDINELLKEFLQKREQEIAQKKEEISQEILEREMEKQTKDPLKTSSPSPSRHIPISIKRILYAEHGTKCSIKSCQKPSEQIHHIQRFSAVKSHDPHYLVPLCKEHHELAHCRDRDYIEIRKKV